MKAYTELILAVITASSRVNGTSLEEDLFNLVEKK